MIPKRLIFAREFRNLSQVNLAERLGSEGKNPSGNISNYETSRAKPSYKTMIKLAKILDFPVGYFYIEEDYLADAIVEIYQNRFDTTKNPYSFAVREVESLKEELREKDDVLLRIKDLVVSFSK